LVLKDSGRQPEILTGFCHGILEMLVNTWLETEDMRQTRIDTLFLLFSFEKKDFSSFRAGRG